MTTQKWTGRRRTSSAPTIAAATPCPTAGCIRSSGTGIPPSSRSASTRSTVTAPGPRSRRCSRRSGPTASCRTSCSGRRIRAISPASVWGTGKTPVTSGITQPPVAATVVRKLWDHAVAAGEGEAFRPRLEALFPKLMAWHRWFRDFRDPEQRGVVVAMHPWETGRDNSPEWDAPGEPIDVSNVGEYVRRDTSHLDAKMRPTKLEYDRYLALVQFGRRWAGTMRASAPKIRSASPTSACP